ncbi:hypothetical protein LEP1GSC068_1374 [Leptospira sp. Fiocruz LV3954]|nr:hypothetical protein LEP1GSC068_1374 [Leptospira sp. Fiocruz LV3954]EMI64385.1 hypothetical protein LEP1GSC076_2950 [Leptospira sp. Fiocruz LV4135]
MIQNCDTVRENLIEFRRNQLSYFVKNWRKKFKKETNHVVKPYRSERHPSLRYRR